MSMGPDAEAGVRLVFVDNLTLQARLGVHPHEKAAPQRVRIAIQLSVVDDSAPTSVGMDDFARVVDYAAVVRAARAVVESGHTLLVETLAERIAEASLTDIRVLRVRVRVEKPDAFPDGTVVGVVIERTRPTACMRR